VLVRSVVVAAVSVQEVEVRCVEQGRWAGVWQLVHLGTLNARHELVGAA